MAATIDSLEIQITNDSKQATNGIDALASSLQKLKTTAKGGAGLTATVNQLKKLNNVLSGIQSPGAKISEIVNSLKPLETIGKTNLNSTLNSLRKLPEITTQLSGMNMGNFANQINRVTSALRPLATEMEKVSRGFSAFPSRIQKVITQNSRLANSGKKARNSFGIMGTGISSLQAKMGIYGVGLRSLGNIMAGWVMESNAYVEDLNLFTVAMGQYADEAFRYAQRVNDAMGIDISEFIRNQGIFMQIATGFGIVEDKAYTMSQGLTQIAYDISSFYNLPIQEAFLKVQSGISGELEPLRRLGYALDVATLQQIAYNYGIDLSVNKMTQAQKAQLRYIAIMQQSKNVMGDMARTILTPANAMRILSQQTVQLRRALGNLLIPILIKIIPYVLAFVEVLTDAINTLAVFFGFKLPSIDYSGLDRVNTSVAGIGTGTADVNKNVGNIGAGTKDISTNVDNINSGAGNIGKSMDKANKSAKELKRTIMGFDELNILTKNGVVTDETPNTGGLPSNGTGGNGSVGDVGGIGGIGGIGGSDLGLPIESYDFLGKLGKQTDELKDKMKSLLKWIGIVGTGFLSWKIADKLYNFFTTGLGGAVFPPLVTGISNVTRALYGTIKGSNAAKSALWMMANSSAAKIFMLSSVIGIIGWRLIDLNENSESFRKGIERIGDMFKWVKIIADGVWYVVKDIGFALLGLLPEGLQDKIMSMFRAMQSGITFVKELLGKLDLDFSDLGITALGIGFLFMPGGKIPGMILLGFEAITLGIRAFGAFSDKTWGKINDSVSEKATGIRDKIVGKWTEIKTNTSETWNNFKGKIDSAIGGADSTVGKKALGIKNKITSKWSEIKSNTGTTWNNLKTTIGEKLSGTFSTVGSKTSSIKNTIGDKWNDITSKTGSKWSSIKSSISEKISGAYSSVSKNSGSIGSIMSSKFGGILSSTRSKWGDIQSNISNKINSAKDTVRSAISKIRNFMDFHWSLPDIRLPHFYITGRFDLFPPSVPRIHVSWYAEGGLPDTGELFVAREAGPEMVGSIGGKTAVVNNDQIVEAVSQGVARAVASVSQQGGEPVVENYIYFGDDKIYQSVQRAQKNTNRRYKTVTSVL